MFILKEVQNEPSPVVELQKKLGIMLSSSTSQVPVDVLVNVSLFVLVESDILLFSMIDKYCGRSERRRTN